MTVRFMIIWRIRNPFNIILKFGFTIRVSICTSELASSVLYVATIWFCNIVAASDRPEFHKSPSQSYMTYPGIIFFNISRNF